MSDEDALLAAIAAKPDEDTPRLVYADWLDEHDQPIRAEFIRVQIEVARVETLPRVLLNRYVDLFKRQQEFLDYHREELLGPLSSLPLDVETEFRRGFTSEVRIGAWRFMHHVDELTSLRPRPDIKVHDVGSYAVAARGEPNHHLKHLAWCISMGMQSSHSPDPTRLRVEDVRTVFASSPEWIHLQELDLRACRIGEAGLEYLLDVRVPHLADLDLSANDLTDTAVTSFIDSGLPPRLKRLILGGNPIGDEGAIELAERWPTGTDDRLQHLNLRFTNIGQPGQQALLARFGGRIELF